MSDSIPIVPPDANGTVPHVGAESEPSAAPDADALKADIAATRAELAATADALAAKLDVKAQAQKKAQHVSEAASEKYAAAKDAAPEPVQKIIDRAQHAAQPVVGKATEDKKRTALIIGGALALVIVLRRVRNRGKKD
ncbi:MAG: DUF3618 domain-containing protein [Jatrophihabitans sp.]